MILKLLLYHLHTVSENVQWHVLIKHISHYQNIVQCSMAEDGARMSAAAFVALERCYYLIIIALVALKIPSGATG